MLYTWYSTRLYLGVKTLSDNYSSALQGCHDSFVRFLGLACDVVDTDYRVKSQGLFLVRFNVF